jgi:hypothetical protein
MGDKAQTVNKLLSFNSGVILKLCLYMLSQFAVYHQYGLILLFFDVSVYE